MSDIKIQDISTHDTSGADLFGDSESFMVELSDDNESIIGGAITIYEDSICLNHSFDHCYSTEM
ncbi:MAG: hypothetical protein RLZZ04_505 [Cyanobacteriota bacterium]|jgi:hypothetical protein